MSCSCQSIIVRLQDGFDDLYPGRDKASEGCCASAQHTAQNPTSGHEAGIAGDVDADLDSNPGTMQAVVNRMAAAMLTGDLPWCDYIIYNRKIFNPDIAPYWRDYYGSNPHESHAHIEAYWSYRNYSGPVLPGIGDTFMSDAQADRIERKIDFLVTNMVRKGGFNRFRVWVQTRLGSERRRVKKNARR